MKTIISLFLLVITASFSETANLDKLHFLEGTWKMENKETYENWKISNAMLEGSSYEVIAGKKVVSEHLSIKAMGAKIVYQARVLDQNNGQAIDFVLNEAVTDAFSFENTAHDFPKKIQYKKINATTIQVAVLGEGDKGFSYRMERQ